ncbi:hypothetical protein EUTSA_v10003392mg, partial [Eutrema salsugineum]
FRLDRELGLEPGLELGLELKTGVNSDLLIFIRICVNLSLMLWYAISVVLVLG